MRTAFPAGGIFAGPAMAELRVAGMEARLHEVTDQLWKRWTTAPDAHAQELPDEGMRSVDEYDLAGDWDDFD